MRSYVRALLCAKCSAVCELFGENAEQWECTNCGSCYASTDDERERWNAEVDDGKTTG